MSDSQLERDRYQFGGFRYGFRGPSTTPSDYIPEMTSLYAFPRREELIESSESSENEDI